jgi:hypothetical protein
MPDDVRAALADGEHVDSKPFSFATATPREAEEFLRANGATRKQATDAVVNNFKPTSSSRDESPVAGWVARDEQPTRPANRSRDETVARIETMTNAAAIRSAASSFPK